MNMNANSPMVELKQDGITLAITLIVLVLITLIGVAALKNGLYQEKMSGNTRDSDRSFQAAETALDEGQNWLLAITDFPTLQTSCSATPCILKQDSTIYPEIASANWWATNSTAVSTTNTASSPQYVIMYERFVPDDATVGLGYAKDGVHYFNITTQGVGITNVARTILQGNVGRRF